jgi:indolepyruvate ferredoxin oxidoreductase
MATHLEGRGVSVLDMAGLAQKAFFSRRSTYPRSLRTRIAMGEADVVLGCDLIVTTSNEALSKIQPGKTRAVVNTAETPTADYAQPTEVRRSGLAQQVRCGCATPMSFVDASALAGADGRWHYAIRSCRPRGKRRRADARRAGAR